ASAARVHQLGDVMPIVHEFTAATRRQTSQPDVRLHRRQVPAADRVLVDGLPVTSIARTAVDMAAARLDFDHLASLIRDGLAWPTVGYQPLAEHLAPYAHRYGYATGADLVDACLEQAGLPPVAA